MTAFFTKRLHDLENKRDQYMHAKGKMKEEYKQFSPTKVSFFMNSWRINMVFSVIIDKEKS